MKQIYGKSASARLAALLASAALLGLASQSALALTASGIDISNQATLNYDVGGVAQNAITSAAATFTVDKKVDVTVAELGGGVTSVSPGQAGAVTSFTVTNTGNDPQDFMLAGAEIATGQTLFAASDNFDTGGLSVFVDANGNDTYEAGTDTATHIDALAAGASKTVFVVASIPLAQMNGDDALVSLTATARIDDTVAGTLGGALTETAGANTAGVDIVFADAAGSDDAARNANHSARDAFTVATATLTVTKTVTVICDPVNGNTNPKNIPGAAVQYAITITNAAGAASATLTQVTETLVAALSFDTGLISGVGAGTNCVAGTGNQSASGFGAVSGTGVTTNYAAPGSAAQAVTAGASVAGQDVTIDFATLAGGGYGLAGGVLPADSFVTVYFNAFVQ